MTVIKPEMISEWVTRKDLLPLSFLKKSAYTGSKRRMNYKLEKTEVMQEAVLRVYAWKGPFSFDNTDPEQIVSADMEFSDAGIDAAVEYLNRLLPELAD